MAKLSDEFLPPQTPAQFAERLYAAAADDIARSLQKALLDLGKNPERRSAQFRAARAARLLQELRGIGQRTNARALIAATDGAAKSVQAGLVHARAQARELGVRPDRPDDQLRAGFTAIETRNVDVIARDIVARQAVALGRFEAEAGFLFRTLSEGAFAGSAFGAGRPGALSGEVAINQAIARGLVAGDPGAIERSVREVFRDPNSEAALSYRKLGNRQVQVGGWTGSLRSYARTVALTRTREATVTARHEGLRELGVQLVQITGKVSVNFCTRYIGMVVSIGGPSGGVPGYIALESLPEGGPPFHPNCSKGTAAYVPGLVSGPRAEAATLARQRFDTARANGTLLAPVGDRTRGEETDSPPRPGGQARRGGRGEEQDSGSDRN